MGLKGKITNRKIRYFHSLLHVGIKCCCLSATKRRRIFLTLLRQHLSSVVGSVVPEAHDHISGTSYTSCISHISHVWCHTIFKLFVLSLSVITYIDCHLSLDCIIVISCLAFGYCWTQIVELHTILLHSLNFLVVGSQASLVHLPQQLSEVDWLVAQQLHWCPVAKRCPHLH